MKTNQIIGQIIQALIIAAVIYLVATQFLVAYKSDVRNRAIDGCAQNSFYQVRFTDAEGREVTMREPQKTLFENCLLEKGIKTQYFPQKQN